MSTLLNLTPSEAGYLLDRPAAAINKAVDTGVIRARKRRHGSSVQRLVGPAELRFLRLAHELDKDLTQTGRRRLYEAVRKLPEDVQRLELGQLVVDLSRIDDDLAKRLERLKAIREQIDERTPEAAIRGTGISAHLVAALARGQTVVEILQDYPSLTGEQVEAAVEYAKAYPKRGRPFPTRSFKRMLGDLASLGAFDEDVDPAGIEPQPIR